MSTIPATERVLDRLYEEDWRSLAFRSAPAPGKDFRSFTWRCDAWLDQGREGACVGFGCTQELIARPVVIQMAEDVATRLAFSIYREAQKIDPWPGEAYEGTSVLAGVKILQQLGLIGEYRWCLTMDDLAFTIGYRGPVIIGVNWHEGMFAPDEKGFIHATGRKLGGHCLLANGVKIVWKNEVITDEEGNETTRRIEPRQIDTERSYFRLHNSWGKDWGVNGECFISWDDMEKLMAAQGDFCVPTVRKPGKA